MQSRTSKDSKDENRTRRERGPLSTGPWCPNCGEPYDGIMCWHCQLGRSQLTKA